MVAGEALQHVGQEGQHEILGGAEAQPPPRARTGEELLGPVGRLENEARVADQRLAVEGQRDRMRVSDEELSAEVLLQPADVIAHRGLAHLELAAGLGEAVSFRDDEEGLQEDWVEHEPAGCAAAFEILDSRYFLHRSTSPCRLLPSCASSRSHV